MKVVVTGGSGQLGTAVVRRLCADRAVERVVVLDLRPPAVASNKVEFARADVQDADLARRFEGADAVIHLAFIVTRAAPRSVFQAVNVEGSKNVFRAAAAAKVPTVVYTSSIAAYGILPGHPEPIVESAPRRRQPEFPYGASKFDVEAFLDEFEPAHPDVAVSRLRPAILAGRRMEHQLGKAFRAGVVPDFWPAPIPLVWDEDVAQAVVLAMKQRARGAFNLSAEEPLLGAEIAEAAGVRRLPVPRALLRDAARLAAWLGLDPGDDPSWLAIEPVPMRVSSERARRELGWKPRYATVRDVARAVGAAAHHRTDPRLRLILKLASLTAEKAARGHPDRQRVEMDAHLELTGRGGGDFILAWHGGKLAVTAGVPRPPTCVVTLSAETLLDLLAGKAIMASAQLTGKVRLEGDPIGLWMLGGIVTGFREQAQSRGLEAWPVRRLARWVGDPGAGAAP